MYQNRKYISLSSSVQQNVAVLKCVHHVFFCIAAFRNEVVPCSAIPVVDLNAWKDHSLAANAYQGPQSYFATTQYLK